jgi:sarcosine oxidase, subunit beta
MEKLIADVVICGAGMAGVSAAYHLAVKQGIKKVLLVDERAPLTLTSDKSTEAYRNWWPGPGDTMVRFMNRSIDLLDHLALESSNYFNMNRRGYVFLTARADQARMMERVAIGISDLGAGPIRTYRGHPDDPAYPAGRPKGYDPGLNGADLVLDTARVRRQYPFIQDTAIAMLHVRRCGWLSAQQLGMYLLQQAKEAGTRYLMGRVSGVDVGKAGVDSVQVTGEKNRWEISTRSFVIAAGPLLKRAGALMGLIFLCSTNFMGKSHSMILKESFPGMFLS